MVTITQLEATTTGKRALHGPVIMLEEAFRPTLDLIVVEIREISSLNFKARMTIVRSLRVNSSWAL